MKGRLPLVQKLRAPGADITPEMLTGSAAVFAPLHAGTSTEGVRIARDYRYGPADRNRLDVFERAKRDSAPRPRARL